MFLNMDNIMIIKLNLIITLYQIILLQTIILIKTIIKTKHINKEMIIPIKSVTTKLNNTTNHLRIMEIVIKTNNLNIQVNNLIKPLNSIVNQTINIHQIKIKHNLMVFNTLTTIIDYHNSYRL